MHDIEQSYDNVETLLAREAIWNYRTYTWRNDLRRQLPRIFLATSWDDSGDMWSVYLSSYEKSQQHNMMWRLMTTCERTNKNTENCQRPYRNYARTIYQSCRSTLIPMHRSYIGALETRSCSTASGETEKTMAVTSLTVIRCSAQRQSISISIRSRVLHRR
jgi:hypothetical protein